MSSPLPQLLVPDSLSTDIFKSISEQVEASTLADPDESVTGSDDIIGQLLDQMIQILPPEERNIFGTGEEKNIEEIIEEANELIRATTPLFSSTDSEKRSWNKSSKAVTASKASENSEKNEKCDNNKRSESDTGSICSSLESIVVKDSFSQELPYSQPTAVSENLEKEEELVEKHKRENQPSENSMPKPMEQNKNISSNFTEPEIITSGKDNSNVNGKNSSPRLQKTSDCEIDYSKERSNKEISVGGKSPLNGHKGAESELESLRQSYITEIQELKLAHNKEVYGLTKQITCLNDKIFELQKHAEVQQNPDLKSREIERLENEIRSQEQILNGYERENKKLCKEISTLKEGWKQRESKLLEEKQRLHNELLGMVSRVTTEALQEQLKDAGETIVKLQLELNTYKGKNKELEATCERLRKEISNCHCGRGGSSTQVQELKSIIARKDLEIAQLNTTLSILKGELRSREVAIPSPYRTEDQELTLSQLQTSLAVERQNYKDLAKEKDLLLKENLDLKRQVRELESIVKRRQRSDSCFPDPQANSRLMYLEKELAARQQSLSTLHDQFLNMQKKYENLIEELENKLKESKEEIQTLKANIKKEEAKSSVKKVKQVAPVVKEETHLLATIRGLRQELTTKEKDINKLNKEIEELRQTNKRLQKEREKQLNALPSKMLSLREKAGLKKAEKTNSIAGSRTSITSPNNNVDPILFAELQEANLILKSKTKSLQEEVKRLEQDLIAMHNKRVHDIYRRL